MSKMSYCSLAEAWGESYENENQNEQNSTDMISYSGGTQFNSELTPQYSKNSEIIKQENTATAPSFTENKYKNDLFKGESFLCSDNSMSFFDNQEKKGSNCFKNNSENNSENNILSDALVKYSNKEDLFNEFIKFMEYKNSINNNQETPIIESFNNLKALNNDNSYVDLLILILFGIIMIFIMDSFVRLGRSKRE